MIRQKIRIAGLALGLALLGCGGASYDGRVFDNGSVTFRLAALSDGFRPIEVEDALLTFRSDRDQATIAVNARCGKDADDVPLQSLTHHLFLQFTERTVNEQRELKLDGRDALRTDMVASLDGVPKRFVVYVLKKNGCVYDFLYIAPPASAAALREFERLVASFESIAP